MLNAQIKYDWKHHGQHTSQQKYASKHKPISGCLFNGCCEVSRGRACACASPEMRGHEHLALPCDAKHTRSCESDLENFLRLAT